LHGLGLQASHINRTRCSLGVQFSLRISPATSFNMKIILALFGSFFTASSLPAPNGCPSILSPSSHLWPLCSGENGSGIPEDYFSCGPVPFWRLEKLEDCAGPDKAPGPGQERIEREKSCIYCNRNCKGSLCLEYRKVDQLNQRVLDWEAENCCKRTDSDTTTTTTTPPTSPTPSSTRRYPQADWVCLYGESNCPKSQLVPPSEREACIPFCGFGLGK